MCVSCSVNQHHLCRLHAMEQIRPIFVLLQWYAHHSTVEPLEANVEPHSSGKWRDDGVAALDRAGEGVHSCAVVVGVKMRRWYMKHDMAGRPIGHLSQRCFRFLCGLSTLLSSSFVNVDNPHRKRQRSYPIKPRETREFQITRLAWRCGAL
eukprot:SAG31_NODE_10549_length_1126_cov_0.853944_1_plen_151_part_00